MKKVIALLLAVIVCASLSACGAKPEANETGNVVNSAAVVEENTAPAETPAPTPAPTVEVKKKTVASGYPVVVLDNEYVKITVEGKFNGGQKFKDFGYNILIENKCDKHVMIVPTNCSADGFMLPLAETPFVDVNQIAPGMKAKAFMFYMNAQNNNTIKSVDDLVNFDGQWQLAFSADGGTWNDFQNVDFEYILP